MIGETMDERQDADEKSQIMIAEWAWQVLCCPLTGSQLRWVTDAELQRLSQRQQRGELRDRLGRAVKEPIEGGVVSDGGRFLYPLVDGILSLIEAEAIEM
ncbi:MAG: hypothetical protein KatS3mg111_4188 [Pirellulaceae bacterium]|nr:MAG: hypothetical protein KatS3mg111_4188 [Pirellulaceae bacterium]